MKDKREEKEDEKLKRRNGNNRGIATKEGAVKSRRRRNRKDRQVGAQNGKVGAQNIQVGVRKSQV